MIEETKIEINLDSNNCEIFINGMPFVKKTIDNNPEYEPSRLYVARRERRLKQKDVAKILNMHSVTYCRKEKGELDFTLNEAFILSDYFDISIEDLLGHLRKK